MASERILISGATGLIGSALERSLTDRGQTVLRLTRSPSGVRDRGWDPMSGELADDVLDGVDVVIHLAGESIDPTKRSPDQRRKIIESRVRGTSAIRRAIERSARPPRAFVTASGAHYYGDRGDDLLTEDAAPGTGFLPEVCQAWEAEARTEATRSVQVRTAIVLTPTGGALQRLLFPFKLGLGGPIGNGRQWWSWIALDDLVAVYEHAALTSTHAGPVNAAHPAPVRQRDFAKVLGGVLRRPAFIPLPRPLVRLAFGEVGDHLLMDSIRTVPGALADEGFSFSHPDLEAALRSML